MTPGLRGTYTEAAICRRGHVEAVDIRLQPIPSNCATCGSKVLRACTSCGASIRGRLETADTQWLPGAEFKPGDFCHNCGQPQPWASRDARIYELENILDGQQVDESTRLLVREQLEALRDSDLSEEQQAERWTRIKRLTPHLVEAGGDIIKSIVSGTIKSQLGL